ncbi:MAG: outer membrane protein assembly factor BamC [Burkholderiales bacterium]|jgi:outer membrane protein assembly factor BamC|nr:outer membrane protein assembly factor BamC [Burkholderiales bacterium]
MLAMIGCSSVENVATGDRVDYRSAPEKAKPLDVPPDLTQLARDSRYQPQAGAVSAAAFQAGTSTSRSTAATPTVAPLALGKVRIERDGHQRWLSTPLRAEQLWPQMQAFWKENGMTLIVDQPLVGLMETDWVENRAKLPEDWLRRMMGRVVDSLYSTGERDKYLTRVESSANGSNVFIAHRGLIEVLGSESQGLSTLWKRRPNDPELEAAMLARLMVKLGLPDDQAKAAVAAPVPVVAVRARVVEGKPAATLHVDDNFDRAWRRVGLTLDRSGFTVEDRDRAQGLYFVRYIDPALAGQEEPGFFTKLFSSEKGDTGPKKFRLSVKAEGSGSTVSVLNSSGQPENGDAGKRIISLLVEDLK